MAALAPSAALYATPALRRPRTPVAAPRARHRLAVATSMEAESVTDLADAISAIGANPARKAGAAAPRAPGGGGTVAARR